jgi:hypothetical protein
VITVLNQRVCKLIDNRIGDSTPSAPFRPRFSGIDALMRQAISREFDRSGFIREISFSSVKSSEESSSRTSDDVLCLTHSLNEGVDDCAAADGRGAFHRLPRSRIRIVKERPGPISRSPGLVALLIMISH